MDSDILKILNEDLIELRQMVRLSEQRLDLQREELNLHTAEFKKMNEKWEKQQEQIELHTEILNQHKAGFEILFKKMEQMGDNLSGEINKLKNG